MARKTLRRGLWTMTAWLAVCAWGMLLGDAHGRFTEVASEAGIDFRHTSGAVGDRYMPETMGAGCAFLDFDNDGLLDILFANGRAWNAASDDATPRLYRNVGGGQFTDATRAAGLDHAMHGMGLAIADIDNDGDSDIFFSNVGRDRLFRNRGDGSFEDITSASGIDQDGAGWSASATFFDYDRDGLLDLFVCGYVEWSPEADLDCGVSAGRPSYCTPTVYPGRASRLYRGQGLGVFADVTNQAGVYRAEGKALGVVALDYDQDGWPDLAVARDTEPDALLHSNGDGTFTEEGIVMGIAFDAQGKATAGMGIDAADIHHDGSVSIAVGNFSNEATGLFTGSAAAYFRDEARSSGAAASSLTRLTFGLFLFDVDLDGVIDLFSANGHIEPRVGEYQQATTYAQTPTLLRGRPGGMFEDVSTLSGLVEAGVGRGAAYGDYDGDGDLDVLVSNNGVMPGRGAPWLLRNDGPTGAWLRVATDGVGANRDGIGAVVSVTVAGVTQRQTVRAGHSYLSQSEHTLTFGLGDADSVDAIEVRWPSGVTDRYTDVPARATLTATEGETQ
jgi:enediyne biosynthesis protein E4